MPKKWPKGQYSLLAHLAFRQSSELVALKVNANDLIAQRRLDELVEAIYEAMRAAGINYALEPVLASERDSAKAPYQLVRLPKEIMGTNKREGTCLDLALFFSGVCLGYGLLPLLIVLGDPKGVKDDHHVLVAVSRTLGLRQWKERPLEEYSLLLRVQVEREHADDICKLITDEAYVPVECTGFAHGHSFIPTLPEGRWREPDGTMLFENAKRAGLAHFDRLREREFLSAIDYGTILRWFEIDPLTEDDAGGRTLNRFDDAQSDRRKPEADPLRYIIDRGEQEDALKAAILSHRAHADRRPLVCVIHGDEAECHDNFVTRLERVSLPRFVGFWQVRHDAEDLILRKRMEPSLRSLAAENWQSVLWGDLAAALTGDREAARDAVIDDLSRRKPAVMIDASLLSEELKDVVPEQLDYFFKFWGTLPPLPTGLLLIVCLSLKYQSRFERGWLRPWGALNDKLRRYVSGLDFRTFEGLDGLCLPRLAAVTQKDATSAVQHPLASRYGLYEDDVIRLYKRMRDAGGRIPMDDLIYELRRLGKAA